MPAIIVPESQVVPVVEAIYEDRVIKPLAPLDLTAGTPITLQIATRVPAPYIPPEAPLAAPHEHALGSVLPTAPVPGGVPPPPGRTGWRFDAVRCLAGIAPARLSIAPPSGRRRPHLSDHPACPIHRVDSALEAIIFVLLGQSSR